jgi:hypothetical protein
VEKVDFNTCLIGDGFFTNYKADDQISKMFSAFFDKLNNLGK